MTDPFLDHPEAIPAAELRATANGDKLPPCPFCGGSSHVVEAGSYRVCCNHCAAEGPSGHSVDDAAAKWCASVSAAPGGELPEIPNEDADFTPDLARKIIAKYQAVIAMRNSDIEELRLRLASPPPSDEGAKVVEECDGGLRSLLPSPDGRGET